MPVKIDKTIVDYKVLKESAKPKAQEATADTANSLIRDEGDNVKIIQMHERVERPEKLIGSTYKIKTPLSEHALYVTINDIVLNPDTPYERRRPFEIFINSKNMDNFQWTVALTRILSAIFRKGGDITFLVEELRAVFDPRGGYFNRGIYMPSLVAEIGSVIEIHMKEIGMIVDEPMPEATKEYLQKKKEEFERHNKQMTAHNEDGFPTGAELCVVCSARAKVFLDGCMTCLNCGDSKCS